MTPRRQVASVLLYLVAVLLIAGGLYDIFVPAVPFHEAFLGVPYDQLDPRFAILDNAQMDAIGGFLIASGVAMIVLVRIPFRRGAAWASIAILALVVIGLSGNAAGMYRVGAPFYVPLIEIALVLIALSIAHGSGAGSPGRVRVVIPSEEELTAKFGEAYRKYSLGTGRMLPPLRRPHSD